MSRKQKSTPRSKDYYVQRDNTIQRGESRIPICLCVDTSISMNIPLESKNAVAMEGTIRVLDGHKIATIDPNSSNRTEHRIDELKRVIKTMINKMKQDPILSKSASLCIISFDLFADCHLEFLDINEVNPNNIKSLKAIKRQTYVGKALSMALDRLDEQMEINQSAEIDTYKPTLIFMSDGTPTDRKDSKIWSSKIRERSENGEINVIPIIIGDELNDQWLKSLTNDNQVYRLKTDEDFKKVFDKITHSIKQQSQVILLDEENINDTEYEEVDEGVLGTVYLGTKKKNYLELLKAHIRKPLQPKS